jgi:hypothetical protein
MLGFFFALLSASSAAILPHNMAENNNGCRALTNASYIDLSLAFDYPVFINATGVAGETYQYEYDCAGNRTSCGDNVSLCQTTADGVRYNAGGAPKFALWMSDSYNIVKELTIVYPAAFLRVAQIVFKLDKTADKPFLQPGGAKGLIEYPTATYNLELHTNCLMVGNPEECGM